LSTGPGVQNLPLITMRLLLKT